VRVGLWLIGFALVACGQRSAFVIADDGGLDSGSLCHTLVQQGELREIEVEPAPGPALPPVTPVVLPVGIFTLASVRYYTGTLSVSTAVFLRQTLEFVDTRLRMVETNRDGELRSEGLVRLQDGVLERQDSCSSSTIGAPQQAKMLLDGGTLTLVTTQVSDDGGVVGAVHSVYTRVLSDAQAP
jgi:hypothetical protein